MLVESYSGMVDSKSRHLKRDFKVQDHVKWIKWMKYLFVQGSKESTRRSSDGVAKFCFPEMRLPSQDREHCAINYILLLYIHMRIERTRKDLSDNTIIFMRLTVVFTLAHFSFRYREMDVHSFFYHPYLSSRV